MKSVPSASADGFVREFRIECLIHLLTQVVLTPLRRDLCLSLILPLDRFDFVNAFAVAFFGEFSAQPGAHNFAHLIV